MALTLEAEDLSAKARVTLSVLGGSVSQNLVAKLQALPCLGGGFCLWESLEIWGLSARIDGVHQGKPCICITDIWTLEGADKLGFTRPWISLSQLPDLVSSSECSKNLRVPSLGNWYSLTTDLQLRVNGQGSSSASLKERVLALASSRH